MPQFLGMLSGRIVLPAAPLPINAPRPLYHTPTFVTLLHTLIVKGKLLELTWLSTVSLLSLNFFHLPFTLS